MFSGAATRRGGRNDHPEDVQLKKLAVLMRKWRELHWTESKGREGERAGKGGGTVTERG